MMKFKYSIQKEDWEKFARYHNAHSPTYRKHLFFKRLRGAAWFLMAVAFVFQFALPATSSIPLFIRIWIPALFMLLALIEGLIDPIKFKRKLEKKLSATLQDYEQDGVFGEREMEFQEDHLIETSIVDGHLSKIPYRWKRIKKVEVFEDRLVIQGFLENISFVVFRCRLEHSEQLDPIAAEARRLFNQARQFSGNVSI